MKFVLCYLLALVLSVGVGWIIVPRLRKRTAGQPILGYVKEHNSKAGTPTMGGWIFILPITVVYLIMNGLESSVGTMTIAVMLGYGLVGFLDDFIKIRSGRNLGLHAYQKLIFQLGIALIVSFFARGLNDSIVLPFVGTEVHLKWLAVPFYIFLFLAITNGVNLTDGLDGLATSTSIVCLCFFAVLMAMHVYRGYLSGEVLNADNEYALIQLVLCAVGALSGFLLFNCFPAKIFMGDTGSLALGGLIASVCVFTEYSLFVPFFGIMFVVSVVSVILQVFSFKVFKRRIFRMAPFHHHLQEKGIAENRVVQIYVAVSVAVSLLLMALTYLR